MKKCLNKIPNNKEYLQKTQSVKEHKDKRIKWGRENIIIKGESEWIVRGEAGII